MPDQKLRALCAQITQERDPKTLTDLIDQLTELLRTEQDTIKAKIQRSLSGYAGKPM